MTPAGIVKFVSLPTSDLFGEIETLAGPETLTTRGPYAVSLTGGIGVTEMFLGAAVTLTGPETFT